MIDRSFILMIWMYLVFYVIYLQHLFWIYQNAKECKLMICIFWYQYHLRRVISLVYHATCTVKPRETEETEETSDFTSKCFKVHVFKLFNIGGRLK
jgi:hypothetical protein